MGTGTAHPSLKVTGWVETRTHQKLMYNPVWLAKRNRGNSWHRSRSSWADVLWKAGWASVCNGRSFFRRYHHCTAWIKQNSWARFPPVSFTLSLMPPGSSHAGFLHPTHLSNPSLVRPRPYFTLCILQLSAHSHFLQQTLPDLLNSIKTSNSTEQHQVWPLCGHHHCCKCTFHLWEYLINVCLSLWNIHSLWTKTASLFTHSCVPNTEHMGGV